MSTIELAAPRTSIESCAAFVAFFADGWRIGATQPQRFFEHFGGRMTADVVLVQPVSRVRSGPRGLRDLFEPLFEVIPDLRGEVVRWGPTEDGLLIELTMRGTLAGQPVEWQAVDRIILRGGLVASRCSYFDTLPLIGALVCHPRALAKLLLMLLTRNRVR
jgi:hypothetical protein